MSELPRETAEQIPARSFYEVLVRATPRFWVTPALVATNVVYFAVAVLMGTSPIAPDPLQLLELGANFGPLTFQGEWWRVASATFVHIGLIHLAFNMWCLWSLGNVAERMFGNATFLLIYFSSGIGGSLASLLWHPEIISAGASGAIFGIAGGLAAFLHLGHVSVPRQVVRELLGSLLFFVGFNLFFGAVWQGIDNAGHVGGLAVGTGLGAVLHRALPSGRRSRMRFLALPVAGVMFVGAARIAKERAGEDPAVLAADARRLESAGESEAALAELTRAVTLDPDFVEGFARLGQIHFAAERYEEAASAFQKAAALSPKSASLKTELGVAYLRLAWYDDAIETFREAIDLDPQLYAPQRNLGIALRLAGRDEEASDAFRIARQMEPSDISMYLASSDLFLQANRLDEAVVVLEEALTWAPESTEVRSAMGLARLRRGEMELAIASLEKAAASEPDEPEHHNRLALAQARAGRHEDALRSIEKALALLPDAPHLLDSLGTVHLYRGELDGAIDSYRRAIALSPHEAVFHYNLSVALKRKGLTAESEAARREARALDHDLEAPPDGHPII